MRNVLVCLLLMAFLAGCGSGGGDNDKAQPKPEPPPPTATLSADPNVIRIPDQGEPVAKTTLTWTSENADQVTDANFGLSSMYGWPMSGSTVAVVPIYYDSPNGTTYEFRMRFAGPSGAVWARCVVTGRK